MNKFNIKPISNNKIDQWIEMGVNVMLIGEHGTGKTTRILDGFKRNKLNYTYFSGSTLDPWVHVIGVPKAKEKDGKEWLDFILPENMDENLEAIFVDEYNRTPKVVRNALLELVQFKSINGRKFPKLKFIWAAVNPPKDNDNDGGNNYDVEEIDPAQLDRFQVIVEVPNHPDKQYFVAKYGQHTATTLLRWWKQQPKTAKVILSPRRLDYIGEYHQKGGDVSDCLPVECNIKELLKNLSVSEEDVILNNVFNNPDENVFKEFIKDAKNFLKYSDKFKEEKFWDFYHHLNPEFVNQVFQENEDFMYHCFYNAMFGDHSKFYEKTINDISKKDKKDIYGKTLKVITQNKNQFSNKKVTVKTSKKTLPQLKNMGNDSGSIQDNQYFHTFAGCFNKIEPSKIRGQIATNGYKSALKVLAKTYKGEDKYEAISLVLATLMSFQKNTVKQIPYYEKLLCSVISHFKDQFTQKEIGVIKTIVKRDKDKINCGDVLLDFLEDDSSSGGYSKVSEDFKNQVKTYMDIIKIT
jgi:hypothetical protein